MSGIRARVHAAKHSQGTGTKSHPALFYSHFIGKGSSIPSRKICAPKKDPPCDGYFGCHGDGSMRGKAKGETLKVFVGSCYLCEPVNLVSRKRSFCNCYLVLL